MQNKSEIAVNDFNESVEMVKRRVEGGHPYISIKTMLGNRFKELASYLQDLLTSRSVPADEKVATLIKAGKIISSLKQWFLERETDISKLVNNFIEAITPALLSTDALRYGSRTQGIPEFFNEYIAGFRPIDHLLSLSFTKSFSEWREEFQKVAINLDLIGKFLVDYDFIPTSVSEPLLHNYIGYNLHLLSIINDLDYRWYKQSIENIEYGSKQAVVVQFLDLLGNFTLKLYLLYPRLGGIFTTYLATWAGTSEPVDILAKVGKIVPDFHHMMQEQMVGVGSHPQLKDLIHGDLDKLKKFLIHSKLIKHQCALERLIAQTLTQPSEHLRREIDNVLHQIVVLIDRHGLRMTNGDDSDSKTWVAKVMASKLYFLANFVLAFYYENSVSRFSEIDGGIYKLFMERAVDHFNYDVLITEPFVFAAIGAKQQKMSLIETAIVKLKNLERRMQQSSPYLRTSFTLLLKSLELITMTISYSEFSTSVNQVLMEERQFIFSPTVLEEIETYLRYLEDYEIADESNTLKPHTPISVSIMNNGAPPSNLFRHFQSLDAYWLNNKYIEVKVPVFGSQSKVFYHD